MDDLIVRAFVRDGKWPTSSVKRYVCGDSELSLFKFNGSFVVIEKVGGLYVFNCTRDIDTWFRYSLIRSLMLRSKELGSLVSVARRVDDSWHFLVADR